MSNNQEKAADALSEAKEYRKKGQYEQALAACSRAIELEPNAYEAYSIRWDVLNGMMSPLEARAKITAEVEAFLDTHPETPEALHIAYWGYMGLPGRTQNVPQSLFEKMLQHPGTKAYLSALTGLAERSQNPREEWEYNRRVINEFTPSNAPILSWYLGAYQDMLRLAEKERSLASDDYLDELIERYLQDYLAYCRREQWPFQLAYTQAVEGVSS
jgi:tetratricopeptide (TPR) repeat protein